MPVYLNTACFFHYTEIASTIWRHEQGAPNSSACTAIAFAWSFNLWQCPDRYISLDNDETAEELWNDVYTSAGRRKFRIKQLNILGGVILPIWGVIDGALTEQAREHDKLLHVVRLQMTNSTQRLVGVHVPEDAMKMVLEGLDELKATTVGKTGSPSIAVTPTYDGAPNGGGGATTGRMGRAFDQDSIEILDG